MQCEKVNLDNYRFYLPARVRNFKFAEPDFSSCIYSLGASVGPGDGDLDGCICFSCHSKLEHCSSLGLKANRSSLPLIWNLISLSLTSMCVFVVLRGSPKYEGCLHVLLHVKYYKIHRNKEVLYFYQNILGDSFRVADRLVG